MIHQATQTEMLFVHELDILTRIRRAINAFYTKHTNDPTHILLGQLDLQALRNALHFGTEGRVVFSRDADDLHFCGLPVLVVSKAHYLAIGTICTFDR